MSSLRLWHWQPFSVTKHVPDEFACRPISWHIAPGLREAAKEPAQIETVCPHRDLDLVAAEKSDACANTVNRRQGLDVSFQVEAQPLLVATAEGTMRDW
jgi:hypothetical protein